MNELCQKISREILGKERQILDDFAKMYLAHLSITGNDLIELAPNICLHCQDEGHYISLFDNKTPCLGRKYWFSLADTQNLFNKQSQNV